MNNQQCSLYNFLDPKLIPRVSTEAACMDDYEVTNLVSENQLIKARGFLAYTSIKPPVDIDFELICPISLRFVEISSVVGSQQSTGIEIFAKDSESNFISIAQATYTVSGVVFANSNFYSRHKPPVKNDKHLAFLKKNTFRCFIKTKVIRVRIFRTLRNTVPCLGAIQIWATPARECSEVTKNTLRTLINKTSHTVQASAAEDVHQNNDDDNFEIPEEFKDALTMEIMAVPMTLPSGHAIDDTTLQKCAQTDAYHGRHSSDPFTGLQFTSERKPILNAALKGRIDLFLLQNSHKRETFNIKRTLGRKPESINLPNNKKIKLNPNSNSDLDDAIAKVMSASNFVCYTNNEELCETLPKCDNCANDQNLYTLPCKHLYCRNCCLDVCKILKCKVCDTIFVKSDVVKINV